MKRSELFFSFLLVPLDFLMIVLAGISAYYIRFSGYTTVIRPVVFNLDFNIYFKALLFVAFFWVLIFALAGLYNIRSARKMVAEFYRVAQACSTGLMFVVIMIFLRRELFESRFIVVVAWLLSIIYITIARFIVRVIQRLLFRKGVGIHRVVIVGDSKTAENLMAEFSRDKGYGYEVVRRLRDFSLETAREFEVFLKNEELDEVLQADPNLSKAETLRLFDFADEHHLTFKYAADLLDTKVLKTEVATIFGTPIVEVVKTPLDGWGRIAKRIFDVICSIALIVIFSPIIILTIIFIKVDSKGPIFFARRDDESPLYRVGQGGRLFQYFKFRSMLPKTDSLRYTELADRNLRKDGPMVKIKDDPRLTRVGKFIRRWSIDELVELFLVLKGDMSLVGPRPHLPEEVARYDRHHRKVLTIKPGMTGMAQTSGRSDLTFEEEVKLDTYYIENWSLLLDLAILLRTPMAVLGNRETE